jgi:peptide deformylase
MIKTTFKTQLEFDLYKVEQKIRMEKGFLTVSERKELKPLLEKDYKPNIVKEEIQVFKGKTIITNYKELRKPTIPVEKGEDVKPIIQDLKDTLNRVGGFGLSANQLGIGKSICFVKIPKMVDKKIEYTELILINPKIIEKSRPIRCNNESCLSFPGIFVDTLRYVFSTVTFLNEKFEEETMLLQDLESFVVLHECSHLLGRTIFEDRYQDHNRRKK